MQSGFYGNRLRIGKVQKPTILELLNFIGPLNNIFGVDYEDYKIKLT
jgi:hypothetical protein